MSQAKWFTVPLLVSALIVASGCSSSKKPAGAGDTSKATSASAPSSGSSGVTAARAAVTAASALPASINIATPLVSKPPAGKKVFYIGDADPNVTRILQGVRSATDTLGWSLKVLSWTTNPADANGLILQAIQQGADYIGYDAVPSQLLQGSLAAARTAKIPVFESFDATTPQGTKNWLFGNIGGVQDFGARGTLNADVVIAHSNGKANVLLVNVPSFPVEKAFGDEAKAEFTKNCPSCTFAELDLPYPDVAGGKLPAEVVAYLRSHPKVDNVIFGTGEFDTGFPAAAKTAGLKLGGDGIQISYQAPGEQNLKDLASGQDLAGVSPGLPYLGYLIVDGMARYSLGMDLTPNWNVVAEQLIQTKANLSDPPSNYDGPSNYAAQFKTLWKLG